MNRADAFALLNEYVQDQSLVRHCLAVEVAMRACARKHGADENKWGIVGLLHQGERIKSYPPWWLQPALPREKWCPGPPVCVCGRCYLCADVA